MSPHNTSQDPNIIRPSTSGSSKWSLSLRFPHQNPVYTSTLLHTCYMHSPSHSSLFVHSNNIGRGVQIIPRYVFFSIPLLPHPSQAQIFSSTPYSQTPSNPHTSLNVSDQLSHPYKTKGKIVILYILMFG